MAKFRNGILGPISGKLGPLVGASWKGIPYLRAAPQTVVKRKASPAQLASRQKFNYLNLFLVPFHPYLNNGFRNACGNKTEINAGFSANYKKVTGAYPDFSIHLEELALSQGKLTQLEDAVVEWINANTLKINWNVKAKRLASFDDQLMLIVYCPLLHICDGFVGGTKRASKSCLFQIDDKFAGQNLHLYAVMLSLDGKIASETTYLGRTVSP